MNLSVFCTFFLILFVVFIESKVFISNRGSSKAKANKNNGKGKIKGIPMDDDIDITDFDIKDKKHDKKVSNGKGLSQIKLNQYFEKVPIFGASLVVEYDDSDINNDNPYIEYGVYFEKKYLRQYITNVQSKLTEDDIKNIIANDLKKDVNDFSITTPEKWIYFIGDNNIPYVTFITEMLGHQTITGHNKDSGVLRFQYVIDAKSSDILTKTNLLAALTLSDQSGNTKIGFKTISEESTYSDLSLINADCKVQDCNHGTSNCAQIKCLTSTDCEGSNEDINGGSGTAMLAFEYTTETFKCFRQLSYGSLAPVNQQVIARVHYSNNYENAFWDGSSITFGDGGNTFYPLVAADVIAHELGHGFTSTYSKLVYSGQSGAMNEAYSDLVGVTCASFIKKQAVNWGIGSDIMKANNVALRYMDNPTKDGSSIDNFNNYYNTLDVHYSSGVFNKAYSLMVIKYKYNINDIFKIATYANQMYWTSQSSMLQGAEGMISAANFLGINSWGIEQSFMEVNVLPNSNTHAIVMNDYPSCGTNCLINYGGCPNNVPCHQIIGGFYRVNGKCYRALTNCWGCLPSPTSYPEALQPVPCGTCKDRCNLQSTDGTCYCDASCVNYGDCCIDKLQYCTTATMNDINQIEYNMHSKYYRYYDQYYYQIITIIGFIIPAFFGLSYYCLFYKNNIKNDYQLIN